MKQHTRSEKHKAAAMGAWGVPASLEDVKAVFAKFLSPEPCPFPWSEGPLSASSTAVTPQLHKMLAAGHLPINALAQVCPARCAAPCACMGLMHGPASAARAASAASSLGACMLAACQGARAERRRVQVNGAPSEDAKEGWGGAGGFVYSRGFVEFFCSPDALKPLAAALQGSKTLSYMATNAAGDASGSEATTAVAWGAFPTSEVKQALVACPDGFKAWAAEAFGLWSMWGDVLEAGSPAKTVIDNIQNSWYLVSVVENDFVTGDVFSFL